MAAGKISIQANDGKVAGIVFEDGNTRKYGMACYK